MALPAETLMADGLRQDLPVTYKTTTLRTLIQALKAVFHHQTSGQFDYPEEQFRGLNIVTEWPLSRQKWPAVVVKFNEGRITNAGVGHEEEFQDDNGLYRRWMHRHFDGSVEFEILALSPYDMNVLSDALIEIISFGKLNAVWELFYDKLYGNQNDPYSVLLQLYQINLNSDVISGTGMNVSPAPWQAEDSMVYTCSYDIELSGGFYNSIPPNLLGLPFVEEVDIESYIQAGDFGGDDEPLPFTDDPDNGWTNPFIYDDDAEVDGKFSIDVADDDYVSGSSATITIEPDALSLGPGGWNVNDLPTFRSDDTPACVYSQTLGLVTLNSEQPQNPGGASYGPYAYRWTGSAWQAMGGVLGLAPSAYSAMYPALTQDSSNVIYAAWYQKTGPVAGGSTQVKKWNGSAWVSVGTPINHDNTVTQLAVCLCADDTGNVYLATIESDSATNIYVQKWNGTTWANLGTQPLPVTASNLVEDGWNGSLAMIWNPSDGRISVAWSELPATPRVRIAEFDGATWNATNFSVTSLQVAVQVFEVESVAFCYDNVTGKNVLAMVTDEQSTTSIHVITGKNGTWTQWRNSHSRATDLAFSSTTCPIVMDAAGSLIISYWGENSNFGNRDNQRYTAWSDGDGAWIDPQITDAIDDQGGSANGPSTAINGNDFYSVWAGRAGSVGGTNVRVWAKHGVIADTN
jgi:hypothetical protein